MAREVVDDELVARFSYRPTDIFEGVISVPEPTKPAFTAISRRPPSSLGRLDSLPLELLYEILKCLRLPSLGRFSRVSLRGKEVAESFPMYRQIVEAIGHAFTILRQAGALGLHKCTTLHAVLHSEKCVSCGGYGPFLLILTAERCCYNCLLVNHSLWMISFPMVEKTFRLSKRRLKKLPIIWSIPGKYDRFGRLSRKKSMKLTNVRAAKTAALKKYGSMEALSAKHPADAFGSWNTVELITRYRNASLNPLSQEEPPTLDTEDGPVQILDPCSGMGVIPFPSISSSGSINNGLWCQGCDWVLTQHAFHAMDASTVSRLVPKGSDPCRYFRKVCYRAYSRAGFLHHSKTCLAEVELLPEDEFRFPGKTALLSEIHRRQAGTDRLQC